MRILPLFFRFFEVIFLPAKSTRFWCPKAHFWPQSLRFCGQSWAQRLWRREYLYFRHADLILGGPRLLPEVVSAGLNLSAREPKYLLLHGKNQACRALYYWPSCQNLGAPYPKMNVVYLLGYPVAKGERAWDWDVALSRDSNCPIVERDSHSRPSHMNSNLLVSFTQFFRTFCPGNGA